MDIEKIINELQEDFDAIAMVRPPYVLEKFVVGAHDHPAQQWMQCVLEMKIKFTALRRVKIQRQIIEKQIERLKAKDDEIANLKADLKEIDLEEMERAAMSAARELEALYAIYKRFNQRFTREELNQFQAEYWRLRLTRQAEQDLLATGHISQGNQDALRQIGESLPLPRPIIEKNYLDRGNRRLLIVVPTENKAVNGLPVLEGLVIPGTIERKVNNIYGLPVADAYNEAVKTALREGANYILTIEDDTFPPPDGLVKLLEHNLDIVGGWYPMRSAVYQGAPIILRGGNRQDLKPDGELHEVYTIPQGFTLFKTDVFRVIEPPWFVTTAHLTQDSYFSQLAREAGFKLWIDTDIRCKHIDRISGTVYE